MTRKKPGSVQAAPGRRGRAAWQIPSGLPGLCSAKTAQGSKTAWRSGAIRAGLGSAQPLRLETGAEQWEAANTNFLKVNTYNYILADISKAA